jgi:subtilisin family serine protease
MHPRTPSARAVLLALVGLTPAALLAAPGAPSSTPPPNEPAGTVAPAPPTDLWGDRFARLGVDRWHAAGFRGRGVTIALLDRGFRGYREHLGHALPARVTAQSFTRGGDLEAYPGQHGILCAEVLHALAPDAELLLADWEPESPGSFLAAVRWAKDHGAHVISSSVVTPHWSDGDGGGAVHRELTGLLGGDVLCFASAGNTATDRNWTGPFRDGGDGWHEWSAGSLDNDLTPWGDDPITVSLYGHAGSGYELVVTDLTAGTEVGRPRTEADGAGRFSASVRFPPRAGHAYRVRLRRLQGPGAPVHLTTTFASLAHTTVGPSVCFPADGPEVVALGAVDHDGHRMGYSACGPESPRPKPDLVAEVPVPSRWRPRPFGGTSAAAPQAAALAALCWSRHPDWTAARVRAALASCARDLGPPGPDPETGFGLLRLPRE